MPSLRLHRPLVLLLALAALLAAGCGKRMTDDDFVIVANTLYENVRARWDAQPNEPWETYLERRVGEACSTNGFDVSAWDSKMREVKKHPERWQDKFEPGVIDQLLQWQEDRLAAQRKP